MMNVLKVAALCTAAALMCVMLRRDQPQMAAALSFAAGIAVLVLMRDEIKQAVQAFSGMAGMTGLGSSGIKTLLQAAGLALISEFAIQLCEDAGEKTLGSRIALAARAAMLVLSIPIINEILEIVAEAMM